MCELYMFWQGQRTHQHSWRQVVVMGLCSHWLRIVSLLQGCFSVPTGWISLTQGQWVAEQCGWSQPRGFVISPLQKNTIWWLSHHWGISQIYVFTVTGKHSTPTAWKMSGWAQNMVPAGNNVLGFIFSIPTECCCLTEGPPGVYWLKTKST